MLKAIQFLASSSSSSSSTGFVTFTRLKQKPPKNPIDFVASLSLIPFPNSRKPIQTLLTTTHNPSSLSPNSSIFTFLKEKGHFCCSCRSFKMSSSHSGSNTTGLSPSSLAAAAQSTGMSRKINFCQWCGGPSKHEIPDGEDKIRAICTLCGKIAYENPKMVVGCLIEHENKILLCKRKIQPSYGLWTLPAGYMEIGESAAEGASRETREEANAEVEILSPFAQLDIPLIGQTYVIFFAKLKTPNFSPGVESSECRLFTYDEIPFDSLAFSSMLVTLKLYLEDIKVGRPRFHYGVINKRPGTGPSAINAYTLDHHMLS